MIACALTALIGFATVIWYSSGEIDEAEIEEEIRQKMEAKNARKEHARRIMGI